MKKQIRSSRTAKAVAPRRPSFLLAPLTAAVLSAIGVTPVAWAGDDTITPDGKTKTRLDVNGKVTDIRTGTVSGDNAFNSFHRFEVGRGKTVNLHLPGGADNLINLVHDRKILINGVLNSIKNGDIGGHVFFADPHGMVVGTQGVLNVGALTVRTPDADFMDRIIGPNGTINAAAVQDLKAGNAPQAANATVDIRGKVNTRQGVDIKARTVDASGTVLVEQPPGNGDLMAGAAVNVGDSGTMRLAQSASGDIRVVADDVAISGTLDASADDRNPGDAGNIAIASQGDIDIESSASLTADGFGDKGKGGDIVVLAADTADVADGASFSARGAGVGKGGSVELSGHVANIGSVEFDLGSDAGKAGRILFDPEHLVIDASNGTTSHGADVALEADKTITFESGGLIDTQQLSGGVSTGDSGSISIAAPKITLKDNTKLLAGVSAGSSYSAGNIDLEAVTTSGGTAQITIGDGTGAAPVIDGGAVTLNAKSTVDSTDVLPVSIPEAVIDIGTADISAAGQLTLAAKAEVTGSVSDEAVGIYAASATSAIHIGDQANISATDANLTSHSGVAVTVAAKPETSSSKDEDGAVATAAVESTSNVLIDGDATIDVADQLRMSATNQVTTTLTATPAGADNGASVAAGIVNAQTNVGIGGDAQIDAGSLQLSATTSTGLDASAIATVGGASEPASGTETDKYLTDYSQYANTEDGQVTTVGALAISDLTSSNTIRLDSSNQIAVDNALTAQAATANRVNLTADGSAVDTSDGVAAALGLNLARVTNDATIAQDIKAGSIDLLASMDGADGKNSFITHAISGVGSDDVGVAGALVSNLLDTQSSARIASPAGGSPITIDTAGAVKVSADNVTESTAEATPKSGGASGDVGIGASVALNILANRTLAEVGDNVTLQNNPSALSLTATAKHTITTLAEAGAKGGVGVTPALALTMASNDTSANIGAGTNALTTSGDISVSAQQITNTTTTASGEAAGSDAAIGAAMALALLDDSVTATTERDITAGSISFEAAGASLSQVTAKASAVGASEADSNGDAADGKTVDDRAQSKLVAGQDKQDKAGVGDSNQQAATTDKVADQDGRSSDADGSGAVSVAAAVGINDQDASVLAQSPDGIDLDAAGNVTLRSTANTDGKVSADGSAVGSDSGSATVGVGAAVGVNLVHSTNNAILGNGSHTVGGLTIEALKTDLVTVSSSDPRTDHYQVTATSGAGAETVGVAGSVALNLVDTDSTATIADGATVASNGGITLQATNATDSTAEATPKIGGASGDVGIGASVALNILANRTLAEVGDNVTLQNNPSSLALTATADHTITTLAEAGAEGGVGVTPALALTMASNHTRARIGAGNAADVANAITVKATQSATETTTASATAAGDKVAVGAALALGLVDDKVLATTARSLTAGGAVDFMASNTTVASLESSASAKGAKSADSNGDADPGASVDEKADAQFGAAKQKQTNSGIGSSSQQDDLDSLSGSEHSASTSEGKVSVAAAVSINNSASSAEVSLPDNMDVRAGGLLSARSLNHTSSSTMADGSATSSGVNIGAAVAVNAMKKHNSASFGNANYEGDGVTVAALMGTDTTNPSTDTFVTTAKAGAGGGTVGVAGALALNLIDVDTKASIATGANVNAGKGSGSGDSAITAQELMLATASATPVAAGSGSTVGVGANAALNFVNTTTTADIADQAAFYGGNDLSVRAESTLSTDAHAEAGAAGDFGFDAAVALTRLDETTRARVGTYSGGDPLTVAGDVRLTATSDGEHTATADGDTKAGTVGVGATTAIIIGAGQSGSNLSDTSFTQASLARDLTADSLGIKAQSDSTYIANATATAGGGKEASEDGGDKAASTTGLDDTSFFQRGTDGADASNDQQGSKVDVAAAAGIAAVQDRVQADVADGVNITLNDALSVDATNTTGVLTLGSGESVNPQSDNGIGVGVALSIINNTTQSIVGDGVHVTQAGDIDVTATSLTNAPGVTDSKGTLYDTELTAAALAGASSSGTSVAGALAVGISLASTEAIVGDGVQVDSAGAVDVTVDNTSTLSTSARADSKSTGSTAVGAAVATNYSDNLYSATIGAGSDISATFLNVNAHNHKLSAPSQVDLLSPDLDDIQDKLDNSAFLGQGNYYSVAVGGAASTGTSVQGSFAVMVADDIVNASIGADGGAETNVQANAGNVSLSAQNNYSAKSFSGGFTAGSDAAVGVASTVLVSSGETTATLADNVAINDAGNVNVEAGAEQDINTFGISGSAASTAGVAGVATVVSSDNLVAARLGAGASVDASGNVTFAADNEFTLFNLAGGAAAGGTAGVGAASAVVTVNNVTQATVADSSAGKYSAINAGGVVKVAASAEEAADTFTAAGAAAGTAGVGAGSAVYVLDTSTEATLGEGATVAGHGSNDTEKLLITADDNSELSTVAGAAGVGGTAGVGAAAAITDITKTTLATIGDNANVDVGAGNVNISAQSAEEITTSGLAFAAGGAAGAAGAVSVLSLDNNTHARVGTSAELNAWGTVAVLADDSMQADGLTGGAGAAGTAGVGASVGVSVIDSSTSALIDNNAKVTGLGHGTGVNYITGYDAALTDYDSSDDFSAPEINEQQEVADSAGASGAGTNFDLLTKKRQSTQHTATGHGVVVNAADDTQIRQATVAGAAGGAAGVALSAGVPVVTTATEAKIASGAQINQEQAGSGSASQSVAVAGASDYYSLMATGNVAGGGGAGVGAGAGVAVLNATTNATVESGARLFALQDVSVTADAREDLAAASVAVAGGGAAGVAGSVSTLVLDTVTQATLGGRTDALGNVVVKAEDRTRTAMMTGGVGGAGVAGVGAAVAVVDLDKHTRASILDNAIVTALGQGDSFNGYTGDSFDATQASTGVGVIADSLQSSLAVAVAGAGGGVAGVAGAISLELEDVTTEAAIGDNARVNEPNSVYLPPTVPGGSYTPESPASTQDVVVAARNGTSTLTLDGGVAGGIAGVAGAVDVGIFNTNTTASIGNGAEVNASRDVLVSSLANTSGNSTAISAAGGIVGVAAGISIYSYGDGLDPNGDEADHISQASDDGSVDLNAVIGQAAGQTKDDTAAGLLADSDNAQLKGISQRAQTARDGINYNSATTQLSTPAGTSATIGSATIKAGSKVGVTSRDGVNTRFTTGAVAGGLVGLGAGVGVAKVHTTNNAQIIDAPDITAQSLALNAITRHNLDGTSLAGAFGLVALEAAVASGHDLSSTQARLSGTNITTTNGGALIVDPDSKAVLVGADAERNVTMTTGGVAGGGVAVGASVADVGINGSVAASVVDTTIETAASQVGNVAINATSKDTAEADATAVAGGIGLAASGAVAMAQVQPSVSTTLENADINSDDTVTVDAQAEERADAQTTGYNLAVGVAAGVSTSTADVAAVVDTVIRNAEIDARNLFVTANSKSPEVTARASGSAGAIYAANATVADASNQSETRLTVSDSDLSALMMLNLGASSNTNQKARASGKTGGIVATGANLARTGSETLTTTLLNGENSLSSGLVIAVRASGEDSNKSMATAGAGGVVAGNAAVASTETGRDSGDDVATRLGKTHISSGVVTINAEHTTEYDATANASSAGLASASGAESTNDLSSRVTTDVGNGSEVNAAGKININAQNEFEDVSTDSAASGGSGGGIAGAGARVDTSILAHTKTSLGDHTLLVSGFTPTLANILLDNPQGYMSDTSTADLFASPGGVYINASSDFAVDSTAEMNVGGVLGGADAISNFNATLDDRVEIGDDNKIATNGALGIGTSQHVSVQHEALAHSFGGGASSDTDATVNVTAGQAVILGNNNDLLAFKNIRLTAGRNAAGFIPSSYQVDAISNAYSSGGIALSDAKATSKVESNTNLTVGAGTRVLGVKDVNLESRPGDPIVSAKGTSRSDELGFIPVTDNDSHTTSKHSGSITMDGDVFAGIYHDNSVHIDSAGNIEHINGAPLFYQYLTEFNPHDYINDHTSALASNAASGGTTGVPVTPKTDAGSSGGGGGLSNLPIDLPGSNGSAAPPDPEEVSVAEVLRGTTTGFDTGAYQLGALHAEGGDLYVQADKVNGSGQITAYGSPTVDVQNDSSNYLVLGKAAITEEGGRVRFTGGATRETTTGLTINDSTAGGLPTIDIRNTSFDAVKGPGETLSQGPAIFIGGDIDNPNGVVKISNQSGSVGQFAPISAQQIQLFVPNGAVAIYLPDSSYHSGSDPVALWRDYQIDIGNDPKMALAYVINSLYDYQGTFYENGDVDGLNHAIFTDNDIQWTSDPDGDVYGSARIFYGQCIPWGGASSDCSGDNDYERPKSLSPINEYYKFNNAAFPKVPLLNLRKTIDDYPADLISTADESALRAKVIVINAETIDINSKVTAGSPTDVEVQLSDTSLAGSFADISDSNKQIGQVATDQGAVYYAINQPGIQGGMEPVSYEDGHIKLQGINASGGGFISLKGDIVSTTTVGQLHVNNGYGHVVVNNDSTVALDVGSINTGSSPLGQVIIDDTKRGFKTWYHDIPGVGTEVRWGNKTFDSAYSICGPDDACGPDDLVYQPLEGQRFHWKEEVNLLRPIQTENDGAQWKYVDVNGDVTETPAYVLRDAFLSTDIPGGPAYKESISGTIGGPGYVWHASYPSGSLGREKGFSGDYEFQFITSAYLSVFKSVRADNPIGIHFDGHESGRVDISSLRSSIRLGGNITNPGGTTSVTAFSGPVDTGVDGHVTSNTIEVVANGGIGTKANPFSATLTGEGGHFRASANTPLPGSFVGKGGIYADFDSDVKLSTVSAHNEVQDVYGRVVINADGSITGMPSSDIAGGKNVEGLSVNLTSRSGHIGSVSEPLTVNAQGIDFFGFLLAGDVNAVADGDIHLRAVDGDLVIGQVRSKAGGDVSLDAPDGAILSARGTTSGQALDDDQLTDIRDRLHLVGSDAIDTARDEAQVAIKQRVEAQYLEYWNLMRNGQLDNGEFALDTDKVPLYRQLAGASLSVGTATDAQVQTYVAGRYADLQGALGAMNVDLDNYQDQFTFTPSAEQVDAVTAGAKFADKPSQLVQAININGLQASVDPAVGADTATIEGRNIRLSARDGIGALGNTLSISFDELRQGDLSDNEAAALAAATAPGDVLLKDSDGETLSFSGIDEAAANRIETVEVSQTVPLFITANGTITAEGVGGSVFLQGNNNLNLKDIYAKNDIRLIAVNDILNATSNAGTIITGGTAGDLVLLAGGNIGQIGNGGLRDDPSFNSDFKPIRYRMGNKLPGDTGVATYNGRLASAVAGGDIAIAAASRDPDGGISQSFGTGRDLVLGRVSAGGDVALTALGGGIYSYRDGLAISGQNVGLYALENIGAATPGMNQLLDMDKYLQVDLGSSGELNAEVSGAGTSPINGNPRGTLRVSSISPLTIGQLTAGERLAVVSDGDLTADKLEAGDPAQGTLYNSGIQAGSGGRVDVNEVVSAGSVNMTAVDGLTVDEVTTGRDISMNAGDDLTIGTLSGGAELDLDSGANLILGDITTRTSQTLVATGDIGFKKLEVIGSATRTAYAYTNFNSRYGTDYRYGLSVDAAAGGVIDALGSSGDVAITTKDYNLSYGSRVGDGIRLKAEGGIGDGLQDPLVVKSGVIFANTEAGDINIRNQGSMDFSWFNAESGSLNLTLSGEAGTIGMGAEQDVNVTVNGSLRSPVSFFRREGDKLPVSQIEARQGALSITTTGELYFPWMEAGTTARIDSGGDLTITRLDSVGDQNITAAYNLYIAHPTVTAGNLYVTSTDDIIRTYSPDVSGNIEFDADRSIEIQGDAVADGYISFVAGSRIYQFRGEDSITSNHASVLLTAGDEIDLTEVAAGTTLDAIAGTGITLREGTSGGAMTLSAAGDLSFSELISDTNILLTSTAGSIMDVPAGNSCPNGDCAPRFAPDFSPVDGGGASASNRARAGEAVTADAATDIVIGDTVAGTTITLTSGADMVLGSTYSVGDQNLTATSGGLTYADLSGDADIVATAGGFIRSGTIIDNDSGGSNDCPYGDCVRPASLPIDDGIGKDGGPGDVHVDVPGDDGGDDNGIPGAGTEFTPGGDAVAAGDLTFTAGDYLVAGSIKAGNDVMLDASTNLVAGTVEATLGRVDATSGGDASLGTVTAANAPITLVSAGDMRLGSVTSGAATGTVVDVNAGGAIIGIGADLDTANIYADADDAAISLIAGTGIAAGGPSGQIDEDDPLVVSTLHLDAVADTGDISIYNLRDLDSASMDAKAGSALVVARGNFKFTGTIHAADNLLVGADGDLEGDKITADGGRVEVHVTGDLALDDVSAATTLDMISDGGMTLGSTDSGGDQTLTSQDDLRFDHLTSGADLSGESTAGSIIGGDFDVAGTATFIAANGVTLDGQLEGRIAQIQASGDVAVHGTGSTTELGQVSGDKVDVQSDGDLSADDVTSATTLAMTSGGGMTLGSTDSDGDQTLTSQDDLRFDHLRSGADLRGESTAGSIIGGDFDVAGTATFIAANGVTLNGPLNGRIDQIQAGGDVAVHGTGSATDLGQVSGDKVDVQSDGDLSADDVTAATTLAMTSGGGMTLGSTDSGDDQILTSQDDLLFTHLNSGADLTGESTAGSIIGGDVDVAGVASFTAANGVTLNGQLNGAIGTVQAGGDVAVHGTGAATELGQVSGDKVDVTSDGDLSADDVTAVTTLAMTSGGGMTLGSTDSGGDQTLTSQDDLRFDHLRSGADLRGESTAGSIIGGDFDVVGTATFIAANGVTLDGQLEGRIDQIQAGGDVAVHGTGSATDLGQVSGDKVDVQSDGDLSADDVTATTTLAVTSGGGMTLGSTDSGGDQTLTSQDDLRFDHLRSGADLRGESTAGSIIGGDFDVAGTATFIAANGVTLDGQLEGRIDQIQAGGDVAVHGTGSTTELGQVSGDKVDIESDGDLSADDVTSATTLAMTSGGGMALGSTDSGDGQTLTSQDDLGFDHLTSGADLRAESTAGSITGGDVDVTGTAEFLAANGVALNGRLNGAIGTVQAGGDVAVHGTGHTTDLGQVSGDKVDVTSDGDLSADDVTAVTTLAMTSGGGMTLGSTDSGGDQTLTSQDDLGFDHLTSGADLRAESTAGSITGGDVDVTGTAEFLAANGVALNGRLNGAIGTVQAGGDVAVHGTGSATDLGQVSGDKVDVQSDGDLSADDVTAATTLAMTSGGGMALGSTDSGGDQTLTSQDDLHFGHLTSGADLSGESTAGSIIGGDFDVAGTATFIAANGVTLNGPLNGRIDQIHAGGDVAVHGTGPTTDLGQVSGDKVDVQSDGDLSADDVTATTTLAMTSGGGMTLGSTDSGDDQTLTSQDDLLFTHLTSGADLTGESTAGAIIGGDVDVAGVASFTAANGVTLNGPLNGRIDQIQAGGDVAVHGTGSTTDLGQVSGDKVDVQSDGDLSADDVTAATTLAMTSGDSMTLGSTDSGGDQSLTAREDLSFVDLNSGGNLGATSGEGSASGQDATAAGDMALHAKQRIQFGRIEAGGRVEADSTEGSISGNQLDAQRGELAAADAIDLDAGNIDRRLNLAASDIDANITQGPTSSTDPFSMVVTGYKNSKARQVRISVDASAGLTLDRLAAEEARIEATADQVRVDDGDISKIMHLDTDSTRVLIDHVNASPDLSTVDVLLTPPRHQFQLQVSGQRVRLNGHGSTTNTPASIPPSDIEALRYMFRMLQDGHQYPGSGISGVINNTRPLTDQVIWSSGDLISTSGSGVALNLDILPVGRGSENIRYRNEAY